MKATHIFEVFTARAYQATLGLVKTTGNLILLTRAAIIRKCPNLFLLYNCSMIVHKHLILSCFIFSPSGISHYKVSAQNLKTNHLVPLNVISCGNIDFLSEPTNGPMLGTPLHLCIPRPHPAGRL